METVIRWTLLNPSGVAQIEAVKANPRPSTLDGKTVLLYWNGKPNGDVFLNRTAKLIEKHAMGVRFVRSWEVAPQTKAISSSADASKRFAGALAAFNPDISIASQGD
ncbi:MAG: hypothetical protein HYX90_07145 [Chloroflexi bacterium]|nr:hypothetical protein [Chloroflexota bacterium]